MSVTVTITDDQVADAIRNGELCPREWHIARSAGVDLHKACKFPGYCR
ncbi:hypothetical protein RGUI_2654 [Rhodovulum sp. P5]|nr:hypothetical protein [Rhodovulum sp. P5]ARE40795.1 hypothetical protein RGUI_2654 [Rhodovulum sp. P5]